MLVGVVERIKAQVLRYKDHPALIIWAIGNELNLNAKNSKVWDAVNDISKMIHQLDPNQLTTSPLAGANPKLLLEIKKRAPDLDTFGRIGGPLGMTVLGPPLAQSDPL